jgi:hypothetical protein
MGIASLNPSYIYYYIYYIYHIYFIPDARAFSVPFDHIPVNFNHLIQRQEDRIHRLVGKSFEHPSVFTISLLECSAETLLSVWISNRRDNKAFSIGRYRERSFSVNFKEIQYSSVDHKREAISVLGKMLNHGINPSPRF